MADPGRSRSLSLPWEGEGSESGRRLRIRLWYYRDTLEGFVFAFCTFPKGFTMETVFITAFLELNRLDGT